MSKYIFIRFKQICTEALCGRVQSSWWQWDEERWRMSVKCSGRSFLLLLLVFFHSAEMCQKRRWQFGLGVQTHTHTLYTHTCMSVSLLSIYNTSLRSETIIYKWTYNSLLSSPFKMKSALYMLHKSTKMTAFKYTYCLYVQMYQIN